MPPTDAVDQPIGGYQQLAPLLAIGFIWSEYTALVLKSN